MAEAATKKTVYETLKSRAPEAVENLEAMVNMRVPNEQILAKMREVTEPMPEFMWTAIEMSLDYLAFKRDIAECRN